MNVSINGVRFATILSEPQKDGASGFIHEHISEPAKHFFQDKFYDYIIEPLANWFGETLQHIVDFLVFHSVDIILVSLMGCGLMIMISPFIKGNYGIWLGRAGLICLVGTVWRISI